MGEHRGLSAAWIRHAPKIDLHRHLLGSARPATLWELARKYDLDVGLQSWEAFQEAVVHHAPARNLEQYIRPWKLFREVIRTPEDIRQIALEAATDAHLDGVRYVEFRSTLPGLPITDGQAPQTRIPPDEYLAAVREGFGAVNAEAFRLVASVPRHAVGPATATVKAQYAAKFFDVVARFRDLVVGVDLTGIESGWSARLFRDIFAGARAAGLPVTIHAGETEGPDEIWAAIEDLGATRIGHGTSAPDDPGLVAELIRRSVVLEVCPTASWLIGRLKSRDRHPVIDCVPPIPFVICTDNPSPNARTLSQELLLASQIAGVDVEAFVQSQYLAAQAAFAPSALAAAGERSGTEAQGETDRISARE